MSTSWDSSHSSRRPYQLQRLTCDLHPSENTMTSSVTITRLPSRNPHPISAKDHHIGEPPSGFRNPWPSFREHGKLEMFKLRFGNNPDKNFVPVPEGPQGSRSEELVKVLQPDWAATQKDKLRATWIGHASFLVEAPADVGSKRGIRILFDPVFAERTSPFSFIGPKRYTRTPCTVDELPDVDIICISHGKQNEV